MMSTLCRPVTVAGIVDYLVGITVAVVVEHLTEGPVELDMGQRGAQGSRHHRRDLIVALHACALTVEGIVTTRGPGAGGWRRRTGCRDRDAWRRCSTGCPRLGCFP